VVSFVFFPFLASCLTLSSKLPSHRISGSSNVSDAISDHGGSNVTNHNSSSEAIGKSRAGEGLGRGMILLDAE
jgi:hypothetical protein